MNIKDTITSIISWTKEREFLDKWGQWTYTFYYTRFYLVLIFFMCEYCFLILIFKII